MSEAVLLVGGPRDGMRMAVQKKTPRIAYQVMPPYDVLVSDDEKFPHAEIHYYEQQRISFGQDDHVDCIYTHEGLSMRDAMIMLIRGYKP